MQRRFVAAAVLAALAAFLIGTISDADVSAREGSLQQTTGAPTPPAGQPPPPGPGGRGGRGGGFTQPDPLDFSDHEGWTQIFDGQSLANWDCDPEFWSVVDGAITARSTAEKPAGTVYCIFTGSEPADFELKLEMKLTGNTNSGIQYRSARNAGRGGGGRGAGAPGAAPTGAPAGGQAAAPAAQQTPPSAPPANAAPAVAPVVTPDPCSMPQYAGAGRGARGGGPGGGAGRGAAGQPGAPGAAPGGAPGAGRGANPRNVGGYQYDFSATGQYPGQLYENGGNGQGGMNRGIITYKGQVVQMIQGRKPRVIGCVGEAYALRGVMNPNDWNQVHIVARRGILIHILNGHVMTISLDEDPTIRKDKGLIAVQIEGNPSEGPLTASFRNIWLRNW